MALFVTRYGSRIRRHIRGKLGAAMRSIFDSQDILSTVAMRLDLFMQSGRMEVAGENQLWALVFRMAEHAVQQKALAYRRLRRREYRYCQLMPAVSWFLPQPDRGGSMSGLDVERVLGSLESDIDRQIVSQWMTGTALRAIATQLGHTQSAVRKRWQRIKRRLRARLESEVLR